MMNLKLYLQAAALAVCFLAGWKVRQMYDDSIQLAALQGAQEVAKAEREREFAVSKALEDKLAVLDERQWVVFRDRNKVVTKTVYRNQCLDDDGVRLINTAKGGATSQHSDSVPPVTGSPRG